jgi:predicted dinucleotide-binding enzyme
MRVATIGSGNIGGTLGSLWARAGHQVMLSSRHPQQLAGLAERAGAGACHGSYEEASAFAEAILLAIPLFAIEEALPRIRPFVSGKVLIDAMNFFPERDRALAEELRRFGGPSSAFVAAKLPEAVLAKAFNSIPYRFLASEANRAGARLAVPWGADDARAGRTAATLIGDAGFDPFEIGSLSNTPVLEPGSKLWLQTLTAAQLKERLLR